MAEEKRIYVVVAETVDTPIGVVNQPCGRIAAQCAHVVSKMQVQRITAMNSQRNWFLLVWEAIARLVQLFTSLDVGLGYKLQPCTTIVLAARDSRELMHIRDLLAEFEHEHFTFEDQNPEAYGDDSKILTAVCTVPVLASEMTLIFGYLELWSHSKEVLNYSLLDDQAKEVIRRSFANQAEQDELMCAGDPLR